MEEENIRINYGNIPSFDGNPDRFHLWWTKFRAFGILSGFGDAIQEQMDPNMPESSDSSINVTTDEGRRQKQAKPQNDMALLSLTMAYSKEGIIGLINRSRTTEWPDGLAYLIVLGLMKKYRPLNTTSKVEMRQIMNRITMQKGSDPALLFEKLAMIEEKYMAPGTKIDKTDLIAVVLDVALDKYQAVLTSEQSKRGDDLTLQDLEIIMNQHWRRLNRRKSPNKQESGEVLFTTFSGTCFHCGKQGHRANNCPSRNGKPSETRTNPRICINCNKRGHIAKDCWFNPTNIKDPKGS
jgi:Zinc knuckle